MKNMRFHYKPPAGVRRQKEYRGKTLQDAHDELRELRRWIATLTEQLEYVIGKEENDGNKDQ